MNQTTTLQLKNLSNNTLIHGIRELVANERKITREILEYINEIERRRLCLELGFPSTIEWLTRSLGYSSSAAYRRIQAARLLRSNEELAEKIEAGTVNLTTLAQVQTTIKAEEKRTGEKMTSQQKTVVISKVEMKSSREAELVLAQMFPQTVSRKESVTVVDETHVRAHVTLTHEQLKKLERIGELLSHRLSQGGVKASLGEIIEAAADDFLNRNDYLKKHDPAVKKEKTAAPRVVSKTSESLRLKDMPQSKTGTGTKKGSNLKNGGNLRWVNQAQKKSNAQSNNQPNLKPLSVALKRKIIKRDQGKCQYVDQRTAQKCESRFHLQVDHSIPRALGGDNHCENLRALCRPHNLFMAENWFGENKIRQYKNPHATK